MQKEFSILIDKSYQETMAAIYELLNKGEANLTPHEIEHLKTMVIGAEKYEDEIMHLKPTLQKKQ